MTLNNGACTNALACIMMLAHRKYSLQHIALLDENFLTPFFKIYVRARLMRLHTFNCSTTRDQILLSCLYAYLLHHTFFYLEKRIYAASYLRIYNCTSTGTRRHCRLLPPLCPLLCLPEKHCAQNSFPAAR